MADLLDTLDTKEAARLLHLSLDELRNRLETGRMAGVKVGRTWRIEKAEVARIVAQHTPQGYERKQQADAVELAGGRVWRSDKG